MKYLASYIILLFSFSVSAQGKEDYDYFLDKAFSSIYSHAEAKVGLTDDLQLNEKDKSFIFYQQIQSQAYAMQGDYLNAAKSVFEKEGLEHKDDGFKSFFLHYCLAEQYHNVGLYRQSQKILTELITTAPLQNNKRKEITLAKIYQLLAMNCAVQKKFQLAYSYLQKSTALAHDNTEEAQIISLYNQILMGSVYLHQKEIDKAEFLLQKILKNPKTRNYPFLESTALEYLSRIRFLQQRYSESSSILHTIALKVSGRNFNVLYQRVLETKSKVALATNNTLEFQKDQKEYEQFKTKIDNSKKAATSYLVAVFEELQSSEIEIEQSRERATTLYFLLISFTFLFLFIGLYYYLNHQEKDYQKQLAFFSTYYRIQNLTPSKESPEYKDDEDMSWQEEKSKEKKTVLLSPEKEKELIEKLEAFEKGVLFLSKQMSLALLAAEMGTNIKYLSEIIKIHKGKKFNQYINELRIQHIISLLKTKPAYLTYKVSYLAEMSGFSSHSAFTSVFKSITGISPNDFIQQLNTQNKK